MRILRNGPVLTLDPWVRKGVWLKLSGRIPFSLISAFYYKIKEKDKAGLNMGEGCGR